MSDSLPQPTQVLVKRLRRAARALRERGSVEDRAYANTCDQAAGRLEMFDAGESPEFIDRMVWVAHQ